MRSAVTGGDSEQMQVVVAEHRDDRVAERFHVAQYGERIGTAIDEVAGEPQSIARRRKIDQRQQLVEFRMTTLDVADRVKRHEKGKARYNSEPL